MTARGAGSSSFRWFPIIPLPVSWSVYVARPDGRGPADLRTTVLERGANPYAEGSCLVRMGGTLVHCTASVETGVPPFKKGSGKGWVTAEYGMLPRATQTDNRERNVRAAGRTSPWLIGRSLRAAMRTFDFGEYTIKVDCDVLTADGGTRCASITGACVALHDACAWLAARTGSPSPFGRLVAAVSVGKVGGHNVLDLAYLEDRDADVDANVVMLEPDAFVEVGNGEAGRSIVLAGRTPRPRAGCPHSSSHCADASVGEEPLHRDAQRGQQPIPRVLIDGYDWCFPTTSPRLQPIEDRLNSSTRARNRAPRQRVCVDRGLDTSPMTATRDRARDARRRRARRFAGARVRTRQSPLTITSSSDDCGHAAVDRSARCRCERVLRRRDGSELTASGISRGRIVDEARGGAGFGYDPIFYSDDLRMTFGEASQRGKDAVSHRGRAVAALRRRLSDGD